MASNRDDFSERTKNAMRLRAGNACSFEGCMQSTSGPSDEGPEAVTNIGVAAHICGAAPGSRRYDPTMTPEERSNISNGIWLCYKHSVLIDRDEETYTADILHEMKSRHEQSQRIDPNRRTFGDTGDVIAIGPNVIGIGEIESFGPDALSVSFKHFIVGNHSDLISFIN
jgi:hypothetical protein